MQNIQLFDNKPFPCAIVCESDVEYAALVAALNVSHNDLEARIKNLEMRFDAQTLSNAITNMWTPVFDYAKEHGLSSR